MSQCVECQSVCDLFWNVWNPRVAKYSKAAHQEGTTNPLDYMPEVSVTVLITLVLSIAPVIRGPQDKGAVLAMAAMRPY